MRISLPIWYVSVNLCSFSSILELFANDYRIRECRRHENVSQCLFSEQGCSAILDFEHIQIMTCLHPSSNKRGFLSMTGYKNDYFNGVENVYLLDPSEMKKKNK